MIPFAYAAKLFVFSAHDILHGFKSSFIDAAFVKSYLNTTPPAEMDEEMDVTGMVRGDDEDPNSCLLLLQAMSTQEASRSVVEINGLWLRVIVSYVDDFYDDLDAPSKQLDYVLDRVQPMDQPLELRIALIALRGNLPTYDRLASQPLTSSDFAIKEVLDRTRKEICAEHP